LPIVCSHDDEVAAIMVRRVHNGRSGSLVAHHEFLRDPRIDGDISVQFIPEAFPVRFGLPLGDRFAEGDILRPSVSTAWRIIRRAWEARASWAAYRTAASDSPVKSVGQRILCQSMMWSPLPFQKANDCNVICQTAS